MMMYPECHLLLCDCMPPCAALLFMSECCASSQVTAQGRWAVEEWPQCSQCNTSSDDMKLLPTKGAMGSHTCVPTCTKFCVPFTVLLLKDAASSCCLPGNLCLL